jgi:hypothetical protein
MPAYSKAAGHKVIALVQGFPAYLFGGWGPSSPAGGGLIVAPTRFLISQVQIATNVATITGTVIEGNIPTVPAANQPASLISITQTQTGGGEFNVTAVAITAVSINASTGIGTITFPLTGSNIGPVADAGIAIIAQPEYGDALVNGASIPCTMPVQDPKTDSARTVSVVCSFPSLPTAATVNLQWAIMDIDSEYENFGTTAVATVAGGAVTVGPGLQFSLNMSRFYRLNATGVSGGTNPTIIGKILV